MPDIVINTVVKNPDLTELQKLKKEMKELQSLALNGDGNAAKRLGELKEKMEDVKDATNTLRGSGVEKLTASFGLLTEGFKNADPGKIGIAFKGLGQAMSAIPIFLLIEGVKLIVENFDKAKEVFKTVFNTFTDGEKRTRSLTNELRKLHEANELATAQLANEIKVLEAQGASQAQILARKRELNALKIKELEIDAQLQKSRIQEIIDNDTLLEGYYRKSAAVLDALGQDEKAAEILKQIDISKKERAEEALKKFKEDHIAIQNLKTEDRVNEITFNKVIHQQKMQNLADFKAADQALSDGAKANQEKTLEELKEFNQKKIDEDLKLKDQLIVNHEDEAEQKRLIDEKEQQANLERNRTFREQENAANIQQAQADLSIAEASNRSLISLSDLYFTMKMNNLQAGSAAELAAAKRQFQINKGLQISSAIISGIQGVINALTASSVIPEPYGTILKVANAVAIGAATAVNIAKISSTQFNPGGSGGGFSAPTVPSTSSNISQTPTPQTVPQQQQSTQFDANGNRIDTPAPIVKVSEINNVQRNVARVEEQSRF